MHSKSFSGNLSSFRYASSLDLKDVTSLGLSEEDAQMFLHMVQQAAIKKEALPSIDWAEFKPVDILSLPQYEKLEPVGDIDKVDILRRFAVVKLNGGVGSTMGLKTPKALLNIKGAETFLSSSITQIKSLNATFAGLDVPLVLMNSFATHNQTVAALQEMDVPESVKVMHFMQRKFPRLSPTTLRPIPNTADAPDECWYPPGHGDVFEMIVRSGVAAELVAQGKDYAFVSNIDNLSADLDASIAQSMIKKNLKVMLEYTARTHNERAGGVLVQRGKHTSCLELSQVPDAVKQFASLEYSSFNTNNMWMHLPSLIKMVEEHDIKLRSSVCLRDLNGADVLQLENQISSIQFCVADAYQLAVPRRRWRVIKTTADLLMVRSPNLLNLHRGRIDVSDARRVRELPAIRWGSMFRSVTDMEDRIPFPPDILDLVHLTVEGDVYFGRNVRLAGTVILIAKDGEKLIIPDGAILHDNIVIGSLTMTPH